MKGTLALYYYYIDIVYLESIYILVIVVNVS